MSAAPELTERQARERVRAQLGIIKAHLGDEISMDTGASVDAADFQYLYRRGSILVRDQDLKRVSQVVPGTVSRGLVNGLTLYQPTNGDTLSALATLDEALGTGVATPDHVLYVTRGAGGCCPATEPEEPDGDPPYPSPNPKRPGRPVAVAVVDTGWIPRAAKNPKTRWLKGVTGEREYYKPSDIRAYVGHGTFVAGVVRCIAPDADVHVEAFLPHGGAVLESDLVVSLNQALDLAPDIITMSAGTRSRKNLDLLGFQVFWETRLRYMSGTVLVAAAGNDGDRRRFFPAAFPWTIGVGALDEAGNRAGFSNYGSWVDVYARGVDLVNAYPKGTFVSQEPPTMGEVRTFDGLARWSGTSFSTPLVSGLIARRMATTGENARVASDALMAKSLLNASPTVGPRLSPADA